MGRTKGSKNKKTKDNKYYIDNEKLEEEVIKCKESGIISDELVKMFYTLIARLNRVNRYNHPDEYKDYESKAMLSLLTMFHKFDPEKGKAFSLFSNQTIFGLGAGYNELHPKKYRGTVRLSYKDKDDGGFDDMYTF